MSNALTSGAAFAPTPIHRRPATAQRAAYSKLSSVIDIGSAGPTEAQPANIKAAPRSARIRRATRVRAGFVRSALLVLPCVAKAAS
jgi:hypothetical protein